MKLIQFKDAGAAPRCKFSMSENLIDVALSYPSQHVPLPCKERIMSDVVLCTLSSLLITNAVFY